MTAGWRNRMFRRLAAVATLALLAGCRIPGGTFGGDALQIRTAEAARLAIMMERESAPPDAQPGRSVAAEVIFLAATE
jgi:hypothetical protein